MGRGRERGRVIVMCVRGKRKGGQAEEGMGKEGGGGREGKGC